MTCNKYVCKNFCVFQPQNRPKPSVTGAYSVDRFYHILHGHGVGSLFGLEDDHHSFTRDEMTACHALLTRVRNALETEWSENCNPDRRLREHEAACEVVYTDHRFQHYHDVTGKPLYIFDDRIPHPPPGCRCDGCDPVAVVGMRYQTVTPIVSNAFKKALYRDMKKYFAFMMGEIARRCDALKNGVGNMFHHCFFAYEPLTVEMRRTGVHFNVLSVPDAVNGYVLNWLEKAFDQQLADYVEYNVVPRCLEAYHIEHTNNRTN